MKGKNLYLGILNETQYHSSGEINIHLIIWRFS